MIKQAFIIILILITNIELGNSQITNHAVQDTNNADFVLQEFIDPEKYTLLAFWAEWCTPCIWELNSWEEYTENWIQNDDINLIAISIDDIENRDSAIVMWNENEWKGELLFTNQSFSIPRYFLYDKNENLIVQKTGFTYGNELVLDSIICSLNPNTFRTYYADIDGDGFGDPNSPFEVCKKPEGTANNNEDCNDLDPEINPDATDIPFNGLDEDCDGEDSTTIVDDDNDGYGNDVDCDDSNPEINPNQDEEPYNGLDDDCNPSTLDDDLDQDGFLLIDDCDDNNAEINPDAEETPNNGIDEDCNGMDLISSTYEIGNSILNIFPNPTIHEINLNITGQLSFKASLYNLNGKLILSEENTTKINVNGVARGTYLLEIKDLKTNQKIVKKVVVEK